MNMFLKLMIITAFVSISHGARDIFTMSVNGQSSEISDSAFGTKILDNPTTKFIDVPMAIQYFDELYENINVSIIVKHCISRRRITVNYDFIL